MVHNYARRLGTSVQSRTGAPVGCDQSCIHPLETGEEGLVCPGCYVLDVPYWSRSSLGRCSSWLEKIYIEFRVDSQVVWKPRKSNCLGTCEGLNLERTQPLWAKLAFGGGWDVQVASG